MPHGLGLMGRSISVFSSSHTLLRRGISMPVGFGVGNEWGF